MTSSSLRSLPVIPCASFANAASHRRASRAARPRSSAVTAMATGLTLYTVPGSRACVASRANAWPAFAAAFRPPHTATYSQIIEWYAAELKQPLNLKPAGDRSSPAYLAVHPFGKLPAGQAEDGTGIFESGALLLYLADKYGGASTPELRVAGSKWVIWANASFWPAVEGTRKAPPAMCAGLEAVLSKTPFLTGSEFGVADVAVGAYLHYAQAFFRERYAAYPALLRYLEGIQARPGFRTTIGAE